MRSLAKESPVINHRSNQPEESNDQSFAYVRMPGGGRPAYAPDQLSVKFNGDFDPGALLAQLAKSGVTATNVFPDEPKDSPLGNYYVLEINPSQLDAVKAQLDGTAGVQYCERVALRYPC